MMTAVEVDFVAVSIYKRFLIEIVEIAYGQLKQNKDTKIIKEVPVLTCMATGKSF